MHGVNALLVYYVGFTDRVLYTVFGAELLEECMHGAPRRGAVPDLRVRHLGVSI